MSKLLYPMFERSPLLALPIIALLIFMVVFVLVAIRALRQSRTEVDSMARLPLDDDGPTPVPVARSQSKDSHSRSQS